MGEGEAEGEGGVGGDGDRDHIGADRLGVAPLGVRPGLVHAAAALVGPQHLTHIEEVPQLFRQIPGSIGGVPALGGLLHVIGLLGVADDHGLAVHAVPGLRVNLLLVHVIVEGLDGLDGAAVGHVGDLRSVPALGPQFGDDLHDLLGHRLVGEAVGHVKDQEIHPRLGQKLHVAADDELVGAIVVAVERLAPPMELPRRADLAVVGVEQDVLSVLGKDLGDIVDLGRAVLTQPEEVENTDFLILPAGGNGGQGAAVLVKAHQHIHVVAVAVHIGHRPFGLGSLGLFFGRSLCGRLRGNFCGCLRRGFGGSLHRGIPLGLGGIGHGGTGGGGDQHQPRQQECRKFFHIVDPPWSDWLHYTISRAGMSRGGEKFAGLAQTEVSGFVDSAKVMKQKRFFTE